ncbi:MAG: lysophospholipid acyltransferase family protein [Syntrophomonadaceae bacterium]|nr:lysophospholipid acyltransferase family protein [Syntrophomonadaceae bacterium]
MVRTCLFVPYFCLLLLLSLLLYLPYYLLYLLGGEKYANGFFYRSILILARMLLWGAGARVEVTGLGNLPADNRICFVSNHQSYADAALLVAYLPRRISFIAKRELKRIPVLGTHMNHLNCIFINQQSIRQSAEAIQKGVERIKQGQPMVIFPEGTRSKGGGMLRFLPGAFKLATRSNAILVPLTIDGTYRLLEEKGWVSSGRVRLIIHSPIRVSDLSPAERNQLPERVRQAIASALAENGSPGYRTGGLNHTQSGCS